MPSEATAQTNGTWNNASGGAWNVTGNWLGGVASGTGASANFSTLDITSVQTVTLDTAYTLGSLLFGDTTTSSSGSWVIGNGGTIGNTLTLNAGSGTTPKITVSGMGNGNATISARVLGTSGFILNDTNTPNPGTLVLSGSNGFTGNVTVNSGTLAFQNTGTTGFSYNSWTSGTLNLNAAGLSLATGVYTAFARPIVLGAGTSTVTNAGTAQTAVTGIISGAGSLQSGSCVGLVILGGSNTFSGGMTVGAGSTLVLNNAGAGAPNAPTSGVFGTGTVTLAGGSMRNLSSALTVTINNVVNVTANTSFPDSTGATSTIFTGSTTLSGGTRTFTADQFLTAFNGPISDGGAGLGLIKAGGKTLVLGGSNTYSGATTLNSGTLRLDNQNALLNSTFTHSGTGTLLFSPTVAANAFTFGGLAASSTAATLALSNTAGTAITLTVGGNNATTSYAGSLTGDGSLVKAGSGTLTLSGSNSYVGTTTLAGGALALGNASALAGGGSLTFAGGVLQYSGSNTSDLAARIVSSTSVVAIDTNNQSVAWTGNLGASNTAGLTKSGAGTLTLNGSNGFTGVTTLAGGTLALGSANALAGGGNVMFSGGVLRYSESNQADLAGRIASSGSAVAIDTNGQSVTFSGGLGATNIGGLTKLGSGTLTLAGSNAYGGTTTLGGGVLALGNSNALPGSGTITFTGGTLQYSASNTTDFASRIVSSTSAIAIDTNSQSVTLAGDLVTSNSGGLTKLGAGTLTLSGSNTFTGAITVTAGTLGLASARAVPSTGATIVLDGGALNRSGTSQGNLTAAISIGAAGGELRNGAATTWTISGSISGGAGTGSLTLNPTSADLVISAANTFTGGTRIVGTVPVAIGADTALGTGTISFEGGSLRTTSAAPRTIANPVAFAGDATFNTSQKDLTFNGPATIQGANRTITVSSTVSLATYNGSIGDGGNALGFTKGGVGTLILGGSNTYAGSTTLNAGTLRLANQNALQNSTLSLSGTGGVIFDSVVAGNAFSIGGLAASNAAATIALRNSASAAIALTVGGNNASTSYAGTLTGIGSLIKSGNGKLTLSGNNSYEGTTTVADGILAVNGNQSSATGGVVIAAAAALMGSGTIGGDTTIAGLHSPGNSPGIQTFIGDLAYSGGSATVLWELGANTTSNSPLAYDQIVVGGDLDFAGLTTLSLSFNGTGSTVNWSDAFWNESRSWTLYSVAGTTTNVGNLLLAGSPGSWLDTQPSPQSLASARPDATFSIAQDGDNVMVVYAVVPEPATLGAAGMGLVIAASLRAWRRRAARESSGGLS